MINGNDVLIKYFGIFFIITGVMRYYYPVARKNELKNTGLPEGFDYLIFLFEILIGIFLLFNIFDKTVILIITLFFLIVGTFLILFNNYKKIINDFNEVWTYQPTSMCVVLHSHYILMIIVLLLNLHQ